jgi:hypothetical protein
MTFVIPANKIVAEGIAFANEARVETVANVYPGRLLIRGTSDDDVAVCGAAGLAIGWAGYEQAAPAYKPATIDTIYQANDRIPVLSAKGCLIRATLATSQVITRGDALVARATGFVTKAAAISGIVAAGATPVTSAAANGVGTVTIAGSQPVGGRIIGYAEQTVTTTGSTASILVRSEI